MNGAIPIRIWVKNTPVILLLPDLTENSSVSSLFSNHIHPECLDFNIDSAKRHTKKGKISAKENDVSEIKEIDP